MSLQPDSYGVSRDEIEAWRTLAVDESITEKGLVKWRAICDLALRALDGPSSEEQRIKNLRWHLSALADQCERGNLVDDHGHEFKRNRVLIEARELLHSLDATSKPFPTEG